MAICNQCLKHTDLIGLCPDCRRLNAQLEGQQNIASQLVSDQRRVVQDQEDSNRRASEHIAERNERTAMHQIAERERIAQEQIENQKELFKESHLNIFKIKLVDCAILFSENKEKATSIAEILLKNADVKDNIKFFWNDIMASKELSEVWLKSWVKMWNETKQEDGKTCFEHCNMFKDGVLIDAEFQKFSKVYWNEVGKVFSTWDTLWANAYSLYTKKSYLYSEAMYRIILAGIGIEGNITNNNANTLINSIVSSMRKLDKNRLPEALAFIKVYAKKYPSLKDGLTYNIACYSALTGDLEYAKKYIKYHFDLPAEKTEQNNIFYALRDEDLTKIRPYLKQIQKELEEKKAQQERDDDKKSQAEFDRKHAKMKADRIANEKRAAKQKRSEFFNKIRFVLWHTMDLAIISYLIYLVSNLMNISKCAGWFVLFYIINAIVSIAIAKIWWDRSRGSGYDNAASFGVWTGLPIFSVVKTFWTLVSMVVISAFSFLIKAISTNF